jgi:hypothetical protein
VILGVTGHQRLSREEGWSNIRRSVRAIVQAAPTPLVGLSSLAVGADQLFAEEVLRQRGELRVVLPFPGYVDRLSADDRPTFRDLLAAAGATLVLPRLTSDQESYLAAGIHIVDNSDVLIAVWDGHPAKGIGGTADIVEYAKSRGVSIQRVDTSPWM